jgi:hypothetical protein
MMSRILPSSASAPKDTELLRLAKLVKLMRGVQTSHDRGDRSATTRNQKLDLERRVDKAVTWVLAHRKESAMAERPRTSP